MTTLADIACRVPGITLQGDRSVVVTGAIHDSRHVKPGHLFAVIRGKNTDGRRYVGDAIKKGAVALLVDAPLPVDVPQMVVSDVRQSLGAVAAACYGNPTDMLQVVGITGTNGKTTTAYLVEAALKAAGHKPGLMSTVEYRYGEKQLAAPHTTPEAPVIQAIVREMADAGMTHMVMEASSHGLVLGRLGGCRFRVVAFTNLTQDHLDFHKNMDAYGAAKMTLFTTAIEENPQAKAVLNVDSPYAQTILEHLTHPAITVSIDPESQADIRPDGIPRYSIQGIVTAVQTPVGPCELHSPLIGQHNLSNLLVALGCCIQLGIKATVACKGLEGIPTVPGRLERIQRDAGFAVLVDYAHTPDALHRALLALKPLTQGRLITVFGCGGDRDHTKRPLMGEAVKKGTDVAIVTSDNPRTEKPDDILQMIIPGIDDPNMPLVSPDGLANVRRGYVVEGDRRRAITAAVGAAGSGDIVLIAGKGHEDYQVLGSEKIHFDDREEALKAMIALEGTEHA
jgi:UDP-N-acetylmuramoyl-L-alanyl-D-glutamate--2,6-diaminopimelate ligase